LIVARICKTCRKTFTPKRCAIYCSKACWWASPQGRKLQKKRYPKYMEMKREYARKNLRTKEGQDYARGNGSRQEMYVALSQIGIGVTKSNNITELFYLLKRAVKRSKKKFLTEFGKPDCQGVGVEFKIGIDYLRTTQLLYNVATKNRLKVRWFPSWDSLELMLEGKGEDESLLFDSYLSYLQWCEKQMLQSLKRKAHSA
jgi:hypothetical protein